MGSGGHSWNTLLARTLLGEIEILEADTVWQVHALQVLMGTPLKALVPTDQSLPKASGELPPSEKQTSI